MNKKINQQHFREMLKQKRRRMKPHQRKRSIKIRTPRRLYPWAVEKKYAKQIASWLRPLRIAVNAWMKAHAESLIKNDSAEYSIVKDTSNVSQEEQLKSSERYCFKNVHRYDGGQSGTWFDVERVGWHVDALPGRGYQELLRTLEGWIGMYFPEIEEGEASAVLMGLGQDSDIVKAFCDGQWSKTATSIIGVEFSTAETWWTSMRDNWISSNYDLIKSVAQRYIDNVNREVERAILNGWSSDSLTEAIMDLGLGLEDWQANRLARDQIGKINGSITQAQNEEAGIEMYEWATAGDERVRGDPRGKYPDAEPSHFAMDGLLCRWDDATVCSYDEGKTWVPRPAEAPLSHPGYEIQCRCTALSRVEDLINQIDRELTEEVA